MTYDLKRTLPIVERGQGQWPLPAGKAVAAVADAGAQAEKSRVWPKVLHTGSATRLLALADQAVVSGTSFVTTVAIGRFALTSELGVYALGMSLLIGLLNAQQSLISLPYTIQRHRPLGTPAEHAGSSLALSGLLSMVATVILTLTALSIWTLDTTPELIAGTWVLAAVAPFVLLREFGREFAFAHLHVAKVLILDIAVAATQLGVIGILAWTGLLSAATALAAIGAGCGLAGALWLCLARETLVMRRDQLLKTMRRSWSLGKWLFANLLTLVMQAQISYWLVAAIAGTTATGIYAACMSVASLANPLILGLSNTMFAKAALAFKEGGGARLRREALHDALLLGATTALFCAVIFLIGENVVHLLYHRQDFAGHGATITVLAVWQLAHAIGIPASNALSTMEYVRTNFYVGLIGTALTVVLVWSLTVEWGLLGAASGLLAGSVARGAARWAVFLAIAHRAIQSEASNSNIAAVTRVLQRSTQSGLWHTYRCNSSQTEGSIGSRFGVKAGDRK